MGPSPAGLGDCCSKHIPHVREQQDSVGNLNRNSYRANSVSLPLPASRLTLGFHKFLSRHLPEREPIMFLFGSDSVVEKLSNRIRIHDS